MLYPINNIKKYVSTYADEYSTYLTTPHHRAAPLIVKNVIDDLCYYDDRKYYIKECIRQNIRYTERYWGLSLLLATEYKRSSVYWEYMSQIVTQHARQLFISVD